MTEVEGCERALKENQMSKETMERLCKMQESKKHREHLKSENRGCTRYRKYESTETPNQTEKRLQMMQHNDREQRKCETLER